MVVPIYEYPKNHWIVPLKWLNHMVSKLHLNKAVILQEKKRSRPWLHCYCSHFNKGTSSLTHRTVRHELNSSEHNAWCNPHAQRTAASKEGPSPREILEVSRSCPASSMRAGPPALQPFPNRRCTQAPAVGGESKCTDAKCWLASPWSKFLEINGVKSASNSREGQKSCRGLSLDSKAMCCWGLQK